MKESEVEQAAGENFKENREEKLLKYIQELSGQIETLKKENSVLTDKLNTVNNFMNNFHFEQDMQIVELIKRTLK